MCAKYLLIRDSNELLGEEIRAKVDEAYAKSNPNSKETFVKQKL